MSGFWGLTSGAAVVMNCGVGVSRVDFGTGTVLREGGSIEVAYNIRENKRRNRFVIFLPCQYTTKYYHYVLLLLSTQLTQSLC